MKGNAGKIITYKFEICSNFLFYVIKNFIEQWCREFAFILVYSYDNVSYLLESDDSNRKNDYNGVMTLETDRIERY